VAIESLIDYNLRVDKLQNARENEDVVWLIINAKHTNRLSLLDLNIKGRIQMRSCGLIKVIIKLVGQLGYLAKFTG
jgi:hypothetical protein